MHLKRLQLTDLFPNSLTAQASSCVFCFDGRSSAVIQGLWILTSIFFAVFLACEVVLYPFIYQDGDFFIQLISGGAIAVLSRSDNLFLLWHAIQPLASNIR